MDIRIEIIICGSLSFPDEDNGDMSIVTAYATLQLIFFHGNTRELHVPQLATVNKGLGTFSGNVARDKGTFDIGSIFNMGMKDLNVYIMTKIFGDIVTVKLLAKKISGLICFINVTCWILLPLPFPQQPWC